MQRRYVAIVLVAAWLLYLYAPGRVRVESSYTVPTAEEKAVHEILEQLPDAQPVPVYGQVLSFRRQFSLVLEGYSNEAEMMALADFFADHDLPVSFFVAGKQTMEHPAVIKYIADAGMQLGNYSLTDEGEMERNHTEKNARQLYLAQKAMQAAGVDTPRYFRGNRTAYSDEILRLAGLCGLQAAVQPNIYLNHRSFTGEEQAWHFVRSLPRGSVISVKIDQELDETELYTPPAQEERPADDPAATLDKEMDIPWEPEEKPRVEILTLLEWLLDACQAEGWEIVSLERLQQAGEESIPAQDVPEELLEKLDATLYPDLVTPEPFGLPRTEPVADAFFDRAVFVGDSIMVGIESYVAYQRREVPGYLGDAQFLAEGGLSVRNALWQVSDASRHPSYNGQRMSIEDAIAQMDVDNVYIMLGMNDILLSDTETYLHNYQTLLQLIMEQSPDVEFYLLSITPGTNKEKLEPGNGQILQYNLALVEFCARYGYHYIDVAHLLRGDDGSLPEEMCSDPQGIGFHFSRQACAVWADCVYRCTPRS